MSKHKLVKFTRSHGSYVKGDIAGFAADHADRLVNAGHAENHVPEKGAPPDQKGGKPGTQPQGGQK